jgi:hypothetical protein
LNRQPVYPSIVYVSRSLLKVGWFIVFSATVNNSSVISWRSVLLVDETGVSGENHRPVASHWQTWSHNVVSSTPWAGFELTTLVLICTDCIGSCKSNYYVITPTTTPPLKVGLNVAGYTVCTTWLRLFRMNRTNNFDQSL